MSPSDDTIARTGTIRRAFARAGVCLAILRLIVLAVAFQVSGMPGAVESREAIHLAPGPNDGCPDERPGRECPPGCPTCHCDHPAAAAPRGVPILAVLPAVVGMLIPLPAGSDFPVPAPATSGVWRPPRTV